MHHYSTVYAGVWFCFTSTPMNATPLFHTCLISMDTEVNRCSGLFREMAWYLHMTVHILPCSTPKCALTMVSDLEVKWHCCTVNMHASNHFFFVLVFIFESRVVQTDLYLLELLILPLLPKCWDYRSILLCLASSMLGTKLKAQCLLDKVPYQLSYVPGPFFIHQCHGRGKWKQAIVMDSGNPNTQEAETGEWLWVQW